VPRRLGPHDAFEQGATAVALLDDVGRRGGDRVAAAANCCMAWTAARSVAS
jgi:hypothetical protein